MSTTPDSQEPLPTDPAATNSAGTTVPPVAQNPADTPAAPGAAEADDEFLDYEPLTPELLEEEAIRGDFVMRWAVVLLALLLASTRIAEPRTLLHIKTGEYIAQHGWVPPAKDVFSATVENRAWTNLSWGFDLLAYEAQHVLGSLAVLSLLKALAVATCFAVLVQISLPGVSTWWGAICAAAAVIACLSHYTVEPHVVTMLGTSLLCWILFTAGFPETPAKRIWWLLPLFLVWAQLDSRMFVGLWLLVLFALGRQLEQVFRKDVVRGVSQGTLWAAILGVILIVNLHPFLYRTLTFPLALYGQEYPALREYFLRLPVVSSAAIPYFPLYAEFFLRSPDPSAIVSLVLMAVAGATLVLNWSRVELRWVFPFVGAVVLACLATHEFPASCIMFCVIAVLNGQAWYQAEFRQTYQVETAEILFSRGGRAGTVCLFALLAYLGGTGRLGRVDAPRIGYGLDPELGNQVASLQEQLSDSFDDRSFNLLPSFGDIMIYLNKKPFIDTRLALYRGKSGEQDILDTYLKLRGYPAPTPGTSPKPQEGADPAASAEKPLADNKGANPRPVTIPAGGKEWLAAFNEYKITNAIVRMGRAPDYDTLYRLLFDGARWKLVKLGAASAIFYRIDRANPALMDYLKKHDLSLVEEAFRPKVPPKDLAHDDISELSFYEKYLWSRKRDIPNAIQEALHLTKMAAELAPVRPDYSPALAVLGIRKAHEGLIENPDCPEGYLALGQGYNFLAQFETLEVLRNRQPLTANIHYFQALAAFRQVLKADPLNHLALIRLRDLYGQAGRWDLQYWAVEQLNQAFIVKKIFLQTQMQADVLMTQSSYTLQRKGELEPQMTAMEREIESRRKRGDNILQIASFCLQEGFVLKALEQLDRAQELLEGTPAAKRLRIELMLEAGRVPEAAIEAGYFEQTARQRNVQNWQFTVALTCLPSGRFEPAARVLDDLILERSRQGTAKVLQSLFPRMSINPLEPWPISATSSALEQATQAQGTIAEARYRLALVHIEKGEGAEATALLQSILDDQPDYSSRPLVAYYYWMLTGIIPDQELPSQQVPVLFEPSEARPVPAAQPAPIAPQSAPLSNKPAPADKPLTDKPEKAVEQPAAEKPATPAAKPAETAVPAVPKPASAAGASSAAPTEPGKASAPKTAPSASSAPAAGIPKK